MEDGRGGRIPSGGRSAGGGGIGKRWEVQAEDTGGVPEEGDIHFRTEDDLIVDAKRVDGAARVGVVANSRAKRAGKADPIEEAGTVLLVAVANNSGAKAIPELARGETVTQHQG